MANSYLDKTGLALVWAKIKELVNGKVDKVDGKGLSTNDYTSNEKTKLSGIATGAQVNVLEGIQKNGTNVTITNKIANISVPTKTSDITNDSGFITSSAVPTATTTTPKMDGTAAVGTETKWAKGDHVHPTDTSRVPTTRKVNGHALSADITITKGDVSLGNVDNTADLDKPISTATQSALDDKVDKVDGKGLSTNDYTTDDKNKLANIASGAEVNQNAFSNVKVGSTTIAADGKTDTLTLVAGDNITLTPDATNDKITITATDTTYTPASTVPKMDGTAAVGSSAKYAREDHVHPSDTSRVPTTRKINNKVLSADITLSASDVSAIPTSAKGAANGVCPLNANSVIDSQYLPSFVDDIVEAYARSGATALSADWLSTTVSGSALTPETGKIYVLMADSGDYAANTQFRWSGSAYVKLNDGGVSSITNEEINTICV